jgi:hypothetical protein
MIFLWVWFGCSISAAIASTVYDWYKSENITPYKLFENFGLSVLWGPAGVILLVIMLVKELGELLEDREIVLIRGRGCCKECGMKDFHKMSCSQQYKGK